MASNWSGEVHLMTSSDNGLWTQQRPPSQPFEVRVCGTPTSGRKVLCDEDRDEAGSHRLPVGAAHPIPQLHRLAQGSLRGLIAARGQAAEVVVRQAAQQKAALRCSRHHCPHRCNPARMHSVPRA